MQKSCDNALKLAQYCNDHPNIKNVYYPGLPHHPQHGRAKELFAHFGAIFSLDLDTHVDCFDFLNRLDCVISSSNLGDVRTLAIPVAHTIYHEMGPERRASMGIADSMVRFSIGIEDVEDLLEDFRQALEGF
jgi:O-acetylhomoserine (thiol)-lyase